MTAPLDPRTVDELVRLSSNAAIDVDLSALSRWKVGGHAALVLEPASVDEVSAVIRFLSRHITPYCVIGDTSNLLFDSAGFGGVLVRIGRTLSQTEVVDGVVSAQAGAAVPDVAWLAGGAGLTGIEHTVGIPGTLGGLIAMNGGSKRKGVGSSVDTIVSIAPDGRITRTPGTEAGFAYRTSQYQSNGHVIVEATLKLENGDPDDIAAEMRAILASRRDRFPSESPNCGSTFLSNPSMYETVGPPGRAIEEAGLKGARRGGAVISEQHANFINNTGGATSDDILWLIRLARDAVFERTGFLMDCEARFVRHDGAVAPAHLAAHERFPSGASQQVGSP